MLKLYGTEISKRRKELQVLIEGYQGLGWEGPGFTAEELADVIIYSRGLLYRETLGTFPARRRNVEVAVKSRRIHATEIH